MRVSMDSAAGSESDVDHCVRARPASEARRCSPQLKMRDGRSLLNEIEERALACRDLFGMQVLNVSRGGTLIQDLGSQWPNAIKHERARHAIGIRTVSASFTRVATIGNSRARAGEQPPITGVETRGRGMVATAWAPDGWWRR